MASDRLHLAGVAETHGSKSLTLPPIPPRWNFQLFVFLTDELTWVIPRIGRHSFINAKAQNKHTPKNEKKKQREKKSTTWDPIVGFSKYKCFCCTVTQKHDLPIPV